MAHQDDMIPKEEAEKGTKGALSRLALLHLSYAKILVDAFGEEKGKDMIAKAIIDYGQRIHERVEKGLPDLPSFGLYDDYGINEEGKQFAHGCTLAKVFKEQNALDLGHMYCYVDAAKMMAMELGGKTIHEKCEACGDDECILVIVQTTEEEREAFANKTGDWREVDPRLFKFK